MRARLHYFMQTARTPGELAARAVAVGAWVITSSSLGCNAAKRQSSPDDLTSASDPNDVKPVLMGAEAKTPYFSLRVLNTKVCTLAPHLAAAPGIKKFAVEVELKGVGTTEVPANPYYATLLDDKGQRFESTALGCIPMLGGAPLTSGASRRGWVTFDVPESSVGQVVAYQPALVDVRAPRAEVELR